MDWPTRLLCPWNSPDKNTGVSCHSLLQGIFQTQGLNSGLLHFKRILYHLSHQESPKMLLVTNKSTWYFKNLDGNVWITLIKYIYIYIYMCVCVCVCVCSSWRHTRERVAQRQYLDGLEEGPVQGKGTSLMWSAGWERGLWASSEFFCVSQSMSVLLQPCDFSTSQPLDAFGKGASWIALQFPLFCISSPL